MVVKSLAAVGCLTILLGLGAAVFFFGGFFSVAADDADPGLVNWVLADVRQASIARHATADAPASLDDPAAVAEGADTYARLSCQSCHGGLGARPARFSQGLNPQPNLKAVIRNMKPGELFWVFKNGIKMSGMPSFGTGATPVPDQQLWSLVAFLKAVPSVSDAELKSWTERHAAQR